MKLGIIRDKKTGRIVNHRSLLKVLLNPILRIFGFQIVSVCEREEVLPGFGISRCRRQISSIRYNLRQNEYIDRRRRLI